MREEKEVYRTDKYVKVSQDELRERVTPEGTSTYTLLCE